MIGVIGLVKAAEAMVKCLENEGVKVVFGYPGAAICPFYDELTKSDIHHVLVRREDNAGHSASGYARISGKPAVCIATSGPGATNLLTAIATAYADSIPLVCITGQVSTDQIGCDVFQEVDITGAAEPFVKYSYLIKNAAELPRVFKEAFYLAGTGRNGPVLIDVPVDIQNTLIDFDYPESIELRTYKPTVKGNTLQVKRVCEALKSSERPLICAGGGVISANAAEELRAFAEKTKIPVVSTMMGLGIFPTEHPLYMGMLGMHGVKTANEAVSKCDTMILIGARVGDRAVRSPKFLAKTTKIIHIDVDPAEIGKNIHVDIPLVGDCGNILEQLCAHADCTERTDWLNELSQIKNEVPTENETQGYVNPKMFIRKLSAKLPENTICVADVGQNQIWTCNNFQFKGGRFLTSGGMGTMGYSVPAAIGAKLASPDSEVVAICGDGSFQMQMMELATIIQEKLAVKIILMRNNRLGMVRELQTIHYSDNQTAIHIADGNPDFVALAKAYGIEAERVCTMAEAEEAIEHLCNAKGAYLLECNVWRNETTL
ncbi:MAG: biosynthetic-type acetolactate synthase large subunit [Oscillospiraceae bacterium]|nr:biosynthetic-type acetolactate synthase large subunit [Oscillospiraceae bacterium]